MIRALSLAIAATLSLGACAAEPSSSVATAKPAAATVASTAKAPVNVIGEDAIRAALERLAPGISIDRIQPSQVPGLVEVATSGHVVYVSNDGKYLMQGTLIDIGTRENLTDRGVAGLRKVALDKIGQDRRIVFAPANVKHRVTVFTDIDCGYCQKLHAGIAEYNKLGIAVEYLFFPRTGIGSESYDKAVSVWCSADRKTALTESKAGKPQSKKTCNNPVAMDYELGQQVGVDGTPAIYAADGSHIGGYVEPKAMLDRLDALAARAAKAP